jgi:hypothetical protein
LDSFHPRISKARATPASEESRIEVAADEALEAAYEDARLEASSETGLPMRAFPPQRPFEFAEIMEWPIVWPGDEE